MLLTTLDERAWSDLPVGGSDDVERLRGASRPEPVAVIVVDTSVLVDNVRNGNVTQVPCSTERTPLY